MDMRIVSDSVAEMFLGQAQEMHQLYEDGDWDNGEDRARALVELAEALLAKAYVPPKAACPRCGADCCDHWGFVSIEGEGGEFAMQDGFCDDCGIGFHTVYVLADVVED